MPVLTLAQVASAATRMAGGRSDWALSEVSLYANIALSEICGVIQHTPAEALALSSTTSGEARYALPQDYHSGIALTLYQGSSSTNTSSHYTTTIPLRQRDARWVDAQPVTNTVTPGVPSDYVPYATWLELYPSPNSAYSLQLRYLAKQPVLVQSSETPFIDERWHPGWLYKTIELLEASRNNVEGEAIARNRYINYMQSQPTDRALKQRDRTGMHVVFGRKVE